MDSERIKYYFEKYKYKLTGFAIDILGGGFYADDLVSRAFIGLMDIEERSEKEVENWIYLKVKRDCLNEIKTSRNRALRHELVQPDDFYIDAKLVKSGVYNEIINEVHAAIDKLPVGERIIFKMRYIDFMKPREICKSLGIKPGTFDTNIMRVKHKLREQFKGREIY